MIRYRVISILLLAMCTTACAQAPTNPVPRIHARDGDSPVATQWRPREIVMAPVGKPGISSAVLVGAVEDEGLYLVRVRMEPGSLNAVHKHPDARVTTILSGTVLYALGTTADPTSGVAYGPGSVYFTPPNTPHWLIATDEAVVYEEAGFGPSKSIPVTRSQP